MAEFLRLELSDQTFTFGSRRQLRDWWQREANLWAWVWEANTPRGLRALANLGRNISEEIANDTPADELSESLSNFFQNAVPSARYSGSSEGQRYLNAYRYAGAAAAAALMIVEQQPAVRANLVGNGPSLIADYAKGVAASFAGMGADRAEMALERKNYRNAIDKLEERVRELEREKDEYIAAREQRIRRWVGAFIRRFRSNLAGAQRAFYEQRDAALKSIRDTEERYRIQMALQAPVQYWAEKAKRHSRWVVTWAAVMIVYFILAALGIYFIAEQAATFLLGVPSGEHSTPVYIIVSGATLGASTLIFWLGRLVTKLFLSEHHLASDAREKAVMMQAFLSMETRETFSSEERAIVLASIFRSSPDGIVKDEGPADLGVQALLARHLAR